MTAPIPNTGPMKFLWAGAGLAAGLGGTLAADRFGNSRERVAELKAEGKGDRYSSDQLTTAAMAGSFGFGAGIAAGLPKQSGSAGLTTATMIVGSALLSTAASAMINSGTDKADDFKFGLGTMAVLTGAGALLAVQDEVKHMPVISKIPMRNLGLAALTAGVGFALPAVASGVADGVPKLLRSFGDS